MQQRNISYDVVLGILSVKEYYHLGEIHLALNLQIILEVYNIARNVSVCMTE